MDFGNRADLDRVDFTLPPPDPRSVALLASVPPGPLRVRIGCPSWNAGMDALFPPRTPARDHLGLYAARFPTVELNATFHALPEPARVEAWARVVPVGFRFCAKVPRAVSHDGGAWGEDAARYRHAWERFGDRAGPGFFQAPPEAAPRYLGELLARVDSLGPAVGAVEVRSPGWFTDGALAPALFDALATRGLATCLSDTPGRRDAVHGTLTSPVLLVRFLAHPSHPSTALRLRAWAERARWWSTRGLRELYLFVHQPDNVGLLDISAEAERVFGELVEPAPPPSRAPPPAAQARLFG